MLCKNYNIDWKLSLCLYSWQPESKFLFTQVRLPPEGVSQATQPQFQEGMEVEVFSRSNDREACGWWSAAIKVIFLLNPLSF